MFIDLRVMVRMDPTLCESHGLLCEAEEECSLPRASRTQNRFNDIVNGLIKA